MSEICAHVPQESVLTGDSGPKRKIRHRSSCPTAMDGGSVGVAGAFTCLTGDSNVKRYDKAT